jgi:hypothetical protein
MREQKTYCCKESGMKCIHIVKSGTIYSCSSLEKPYIPSLFELEEYCCTNDHIKCPFHLKELIGLTRRADETSAAAL